MNICEDEIVVEIGAGSGNLTKELLKKTSRVIAIEKDKNWAAFLRKSLNLKKDDFPQIIEGDVRDVLEEISGKYQKYKIVGNIPYYLSGQLLRIFQKLANPPKLIILTLQKEVAQKIIASPPRFNQLAAIVQLWSKAKILFNLKPKDFYPSPKVSSAVVKFEVLPLEKRLKNENKIIEFLKIAYRQPRKTILNNLSRKFDKSKVENALNKLRLDRKTRPANLSLSLWISLIKKFYS